MGDTYDLQQVFMSLGLYGWLVIKITCGQNKREGVMGSSRGNRRKKLLDYKKANWKKNFPSHWETVSSTDSESVKQAVELPLLCLLIYSRNTYWEPAMCMCPGLIWMLGNISEQTRRGSLPSCSLHSSEKTGTQQGNKCITVGQMGMNAEESSVPDRVWWWGGGC